jgi:hypothetical protein
MVNQVKYYRIHKSSKKVLIPEIRDELKKLYYGKDKDFESFLSEHFYDLHYRAKLEEQPINLGC